MANPSLMPSLFVTDFGPFPAVEKDDYTKALQKLGKALPRPESIVMMSGHWESKGTAMVTASEKSAAMHDFSGFSQEFYHLDYSCPGNPGLAREILQLLSNEGIQAKADRLRQLDHGAWVPLSRMYPRADIPVVQVSTLSSQENFRMGRALSVLRRRGILLVGSGALIHNLPLAFAHAKNDPADGWALEFDEWLRDRLDDGKTNELLAYRTAAPSALVAAPTPEHFDPLFFPLGAADDPKPSYFHQSIRFGNGLMKVLMWDKSAKIGV